MVAPLTLAELQIQYAQFCERRAVKPRLGDPRAHRQREPVPVPVSVRGAARSPRGDGLPNLLSCNRDVSTRSVCRRGATPPIPAKPGGVVAAPSDEVDEVQFLPDVSAPGRWKFKRALYRGRKPLAPLALGGTTAGNLYPNYHGRRRPRWTAVPRTRTTRKKKRKWMAVEICGRECGSASWCRGRHLRTLVGEYLGSWASGGGGGRHDHCGISTPSFENHE